MPNLQPMSERAPASRSPSIPCDRGARGAPPRCRATPARSQRRLPGCGLTTRVIAVTSGKGGVGKTVVATNLAIALQRRGERVLLLDADLGLGSIGSLLGLRPRTSLRDVLQGDCDILDTLMHGPGGLRIVPGTGGVEDLTRLSGPQRLRLLDQVDVLDGAFDTLILDTAPGLSSDVLFLAAAAQEIVVVVTPELPALDDARALIAALVRRYDETSFGVLVNFARNEREARRAFAHLESCTQGLRSVGLHHLGSIPWDARILESVRRQRAVVDLDPDCPSARAFASLAGYFVETPPDPRIKGGLQFFFRRMVAAPRTPAAASDA